MLQIKRTTIGGDDDDISLKGWRTIIVVLYVKTKNFKKIEIRWRCCHLIPTYPTLLESLLSNRYEWITCFSIRCNCQASYVAQSRDIRVPLWFCWKTLAYFWIFRVSFQIQTELFFLNHRYEHSLRIIHELLYHRLFLIHICNFISFFLLLLLHPPQMIPLTATAGGDTVGAPKGGRTVGASSSLQ